MLKEFFLFELRYRVARPATYIYFFIFFLMTFLAVTTDSVVIGGSTGRVYRNAPLVINNFVNILTVFGIFVVAAVMGVPVYRDREFRTDTFFYALPFTKKSYLGGRFLGSYATLVFIFSSILIAVLFGTIWPWLDSSKIGPFQFEAYWTSLCWFLLPNLFFSGTIFFCMVALTRNIVASYSGSAIVFVTYLISLTLSSDLEDQYLAALLDPFGIHAANLYTRYWTVPEQNVQTIALEGVVLYNRVLWFIVAASLLAYTLIRAKLQLPSGGGKHRKKKDYKTVDFREAARLPIPRTRKFYSFDLHVNQVFSMGWIDFMNIVKDKLFLSILFAGLIFLMLDGWYMDRIYGTLTYPVTYNMLSIKNGAFVFLAYAILILYSGELVWKERSIKYSEITDALPVPNWLFYASKLVAIFLICLILVLTIMFAGLMVQTAKGFTQYQPELYFKELFLITLPDYLLFALLCFFIHVLINQKFLGVFISITFWIGLSALLIVGYDHPLYRYSALPPYTISDMNGYGHFVEGIAWFTLYWTFFALFLTVLGNLLWPRGKETTIRNRLRIAKARFRLPARVSMIVSLGLWLASGGWIYYNTHLLQVYRSDESKTEHQVQYEQRYKQYEDSPQPTISSVKVSLDFDPKKRALYVNGTYIIQNNTAFTIDTIHVQVPPEVRVSTLTFEREIAHSLAKDSLLGYYMFSAKSPLGPGESWNMGFDLEISPEGFAAGTSNQPINYNGSYIAHSNLPSLGYDPSKELVDEETRKKNGLGKREPLPTPKDSAQLNENLYARDAHWIDFSAVVSTTAEQTAIAPGYLQREWIEEDQRYFQYKLDVPILKFFSFLSARYEVKREKWLSPSGKAVNLEIYHHPTHRYNLDRMLQAMRSTLDYCSTSFGPYPFRQLRIVEFPRYQKSAQSFPNTIPFSESLGFIMKVKATPDAIDFPFYVTAHEVAHQWWGNQVVGANVRGSVILTETLAQYVALAVMQQTFGDESIHRFLRYELDGYLSSRAREAEKEEPLLKATHQRYVYHNKGSLALFTLQQYLGEVHMNQLLKEYLQLTAYQSPPYTHAEEFYRFLEQGTPDSLQYLLHDLFKEITLYENVARSGRYRTLPDGRFEVELTIDVKKWYMDSLMQEQEAPMNDLIEIGVYGEGNKGQKGKALLLEKHWLTSGEHTFSFIVDELPEQAGIDPRHLLIDRTPEDNMVNFSIF